MSSVSSEQTPAEPAGQVFIRRSSGLTRQVSARDALAYSSMNPGLLYCLIYAVWIVPLFAAEGGVSTTFVFLGPLLLFAPAALYWLFSIAMPRSGGEYVYVSRTLHPLAGLFACWMLTITSLSWFGQLTDWWMKWGLADSFISYGIRTGSTGLMSVGTFLEGRWQRTVIGTLGMLLMLYIFFKGTRWMMRVAYAAIVTSFLAVILLGIAILITGHNGILNNMTALTGIHASAILSYASHQGVLKLTIGATVLAAATYVVLNGLGATYSANIAGEVRGVQRTQAFALFGSLLVMMGLWALAYNEVGHGFGGTGIWNGVAMAFNNGASIYPFGGSAAHHVAALSQGLGSGREPFPTLWLAFTNGGPFIIFIFAFCFMVSTFASAGGLGFAPIRNVFAWSFDRLIPTKFSELDRRYRAPWLSLVVVTFVAWLFMMVDIWKPAWDTDISFTIAAWMIGWLIVGIAGMFFPTTRPQMFRSTPPIVQRTLPLVPTVGGVLALSVLAFIVSFTFVSGTATEMGLVAAVGAFGVISLSWVARHYDGRVPLISLFGWLTFAMAGFVEWSILLPLFPAGGQPAAQHWSALAPIPVMMVCPVIIYAIAWLHARRRQIPLRLQFAEVPPE